MADPFDYIESRFDADELIEEFGQTVSIRRTTNGGVAWAPTQTTADSSTFGARTEFNLRQLQSGNVLEKDQRWYLAAGPLVALAIEPAVGDVLVVGGVPLGSLLTVSPLNPGGVAVYFDCHVRV